MFEDYLRELSQVQLLTKERERYLWAQYKQYEDSEARNRLIEAYQPLVFKIVMKLKPREDRLLDLIQEATIGLIEAVERFDPDKGVAFPTFATFRIRGQMINYLQKYKSESLSLEHSLNEEDLQSLSEIIADDQMELERDALKKIIVEEPVNQALAKLPEKERYILKAVFLEDEDPQKVAEALQISLPHLYRLQKKGLKRLKGMFKKSTAL